jgi:cytochrome c biogenesis protein CcdA
MSAALLLTTASIALLDSLNPSLFVAQFYLLTTPRPAARIVSYIAGVLTANFLGGLLFLFGVQALLVTFVTRVSPTWLYGAALTLGIALIVFGVWMPLTAQASEPARQPHSLHPLHTFVLGAVVMVNELTTALPYFVAIERITSAGVSTAAALTMMVIYNLIFALPLFVFLALFMAYGARFSTQTARINAAISAWAPRVIKYGSLALGLFLALNAAIFFVRGDALLA